MSEMTWEDVKKDTEQAFREYLEEYVATDDRPKFLDEPDYDGTLHEYADGGVPTYTADLLSVVASDSDLWSRESELGPAYDGTPTLVNLAAGIVYEALTEHLYSVVETMKEEAEDA